MAVDAAVASTTLKDLPIITSPITDLPRVMKLRSGGIAPLLAAEAAASLANGLERTGQKSPKKWKKSG